MLAKQEALVGRAEGERSTPGSSQVSWWTGDLGCFKDL
jgi:hypothetical protein